MEEPGRLSWWERFVEGLEEAASACPLEKNEALQGEEGWKKHEIDHLSELWSRVADKKSKEIEEAYQKEMMEERGFEEKGVDKSNLVVQTAISFRQIWNSNWHGLYGFFNDVTLIHPMKYTYDYAPPSARPCDSLQIFSARVIQAASPRHPLRVFGMIAVRDAVDRNRNILFNRARDNCQTLSEANPYLVLTGPTRTVVAENDHVTFEVYLKVKGDTENEDTYLFYCVDHLFSGTSYIAGSSVNNVSPFRCCNKHGMLEIRVGEIRSSVEATIFVRVVDGLWPDGFYGHFAARTSSERQDIILLNFEADKAPVDDDRYLNFSRQVVSVELEGVLTVNFKAWRNDKACQDDKPVTGEVRLKPFKAGRSYGTLHLGSCEMEVLVAWSQVSPEPHPDVPDMD